MRTHRFLVLVALVVLALSLGVNVGLAAKAVTLKVGATPVPHAELLDLVKPDLAAEGVNLEVIVFNDYVQPNLALADKELDANFFQHIPYLDQFSADRRLDLTWVTKVHIEPMGVYSKKISDLSQLRNGGIVGIPNDPTNGGRALLLLEQTGLIKLREGVGVTATVLDVTDNSKNLRIRELEAAQLPRVLPDVDIAVINTNFALEANLVPTKDALFIENANSPYANIVAVRKGDEHNPAIEKLVAALTSDKVRDYLLSEYKGAIVPAF